MGQATDAVKVFGFGFILGGRLLGHQHDLLAGLHGHFEGLDRFRAADEKRDHHVRKDHDVAQRQQRQFEGFRERVGVRHQCAFEMGLSPLDGGGEPDFKNPRLSSSRRPWAGRRRSATAGCHR
ncbi:hypothetical protein SDC9_201776 [bioreactor metagenome]|uniref:Uncharacterized protein n=1 Tax=bioreactor metagenome TaxID=1076179 RepID=A0A645ISA8_9ZZZZ